MALYRGKADGTFQEIAGLGYLDGNNVGTIVSYGGTGLPAGYLDCDGSAVSRTTYAELFAVIGTTYGSGDGSTTFNLPNLTDKYLKGKGAKNVGANQSAGLPLPVVASVGNHTHNLTLGWTEPSEKTGNWRSVAKSDEIDNMDIDLGGAHSHSITENDVYKSSNTTVDVDAVIVKFCIKYTKTLGTLAEVDNITTHNDSNGKLAVVYQEMFNMTHPINSVWIQYTANDNPNTLFNVDGKYSSTWEDVSETYNGRALWISSISDAGTQITGSLPNITGAITGDYLLPNAGSGSYTETSALKTQKVGNLGASGGGANSWSVEIDASRNNSIYSASAGANVVRPTSTTVKMWKRIS